jgi:TP901 family phage tail tape measure protein
MSSDSIKLKVEGDLSSFLTSIKKALNEVNKFKLLMDAASKSLFEAMQSGEIDKQSVAFKTLNAAVSSYTGKLKDVSSMASVYEKMGGSVKHIVEETAALTDGNAYLAAAVLNMGKAASDTAGKFKHMSDSLASLIKSIGSGRLKEATADFASLKRSVDVLSKGLKDGAISSKDFMSYILALSEKTKNLGKTTISTASIMQSLTKAYTQGYISAKDYTDGVGQLGKTLNWTATSFKELKVYIDAYKKSGDKLILTNKFINDSFDKLFKTSDPQQLTAGIKLLSEHLLKLQPSVQGVEQLVKAFDRLDSVGKSKGLTKYIDDVIARYRLMLSSGKELGSSTVENINKAISVWEKYKLSLHKVESETLRLGKSMNTLTKSTNPKELSLAFKELASQLLKIDPSVKGVEKLVLTLQRLGKVEYSGMGTLVKYLDEVIIRYKLMLSSGEKLDAVTVSSLKSSIAMWEKYKATLSGINKPTVQAVKSVDILGRAFGTLGARIKRITEFYIARGLIFSLYNLAATSTETAKSLEQSFVNVQAIMGATNSEMEKLKNTVYETGAYTGLGYVELADSLAELARAGFDAEQSMSLVNASAQMSKATMTDLSTVSKTLITITKTWGITVEEMPSVMDDLTDAVNHSKMSFADFSRGIGSVANIAAKSGVSVRELAVAMGVLNDQGISAERAGTALRGAFSMLLAGTNKLQEAFGRFGIDIEKVNLKTQSLGDVLSYLHGNLTKAQIQAASYSGMSRKMAQGLAALVSATEEFNNAMARSVKGQTALVLAQQLSTVNVSLERMKRAFEGAFVKVFSEFTPAIKNVTSGVSAFANNLGDVLPVMFKVTAALGGMYLAFKSLTLVSKVYKFFTDFSSALINLTKYVWANVIALEAQTVATETATVATATFKTVMGGILTVGAGILTYLTMSKLLTDDSTESIMNNINALEAQVNNLTELEKVLKRAGSSWDEETMKALSRGLDVDFKEMVKQYGSIEKAQKKVNELLTKELEIRKNNLKVMREQASVKMFDELDKGFAKIDELTVNIESIGGAWSFVKEMYDMASDSMLGQEAVLDGATEREMVRATALKEHMQKIASEIIKIKLFDPSKIDAVNQKVDEYLNKLPKEFQDTFKRLTTTTDEFSDQLEHIFSLGSVSDFNKELAKSLGVYSRLENELKNVGKSWSDTGYIISKISSDTVLTTEKTAIYSQLVESLKGKVDNLDAAHQQVITALEKEVSKQSELNAGVEKQIEFESMKSQIKLAEEQTISEINLRYAEQQEVVSGVYKEANKISAEYDKTDKSMRTVLTSELLLLEAITKTKNQLKEEEYYRKLSEQRNKVIKTLNKDILELTKERTNYVKSIYDYELQLSELSKKKASISEKIVDLEVELGNITEKNAAKLKESIASEELSELEDKVSKLKDAGNYKEAADLLNDMSSTAEDTAKLYDKGSTKYDEWISKARDLLKDEQDMLEFQRVSIDNAKKSTELTVSNISNMISKLGELKDSLTLKATVDDKELLKSVENALNMLNSGGDLPDIKADVEFDFQQIQEELNKLKDLKVNVTAVISGTEGLSSSNAKTEGTFHTGGLIGGAVGRGRELLAKVLEGEYVIRPEAVSRLGVGLLDYINTNMKLPKFHTGGLVSQSSQQPKVLGTYELNLITDTGTYQTQTTEDVMSKLMEDIRLSKRLKGGR